MIRKKKNNEKKEEMQKRDIMLKMQQEQDKQRKQKQKILTENLRKTYCHIKPTIIQGQRILKVIEEMTQKIQFIKLIDSSLIESLKKEDFIQFSPKNRRLLQDLQTKENSFLQIKEEISQKLIEFNAYNDDEFLDIQDIENLDLNEDQKEIVEKIEELEQDLNQQTQEIKFVIKKLQQGISNNENDQRLLNNLLEKVKKITDLDNDVVDSAISMKYLFLKKLSTGYDEEQTHKEMLKRLGKNIQQNETLLQSSEEQLKQIIEDRQEMNQNKNNEITNLKNELNSVKQNEKEKMQKLKEESHQRLEDMKNFHLEKKKNLIQIINNIKNDLQEVEKQNTEKESKLNKQNEDNRKRQENSLSEYDNEIRETTRKYQQEFTEYEQIKKQIQICEQRCQELKFKKKVNKQLIDEWDQKLKTIEIENEKKENAAGMIINIWKMFVQKSKKKSKKKKKNK